MWESVLLNDKHGLSLLKAAKLSGDISGVATDVSRHVCCTCLWSTFDCGGFRFAGILRLAQEKVSLDYHWPAVIICYDATRFFTFVASTTKFRPGGSRVEGVQFGL